MTAEEILEVVTSRGFLAVGVPLLSITTEWIIRLTAKPDDEPTFLIKDLDYGMSLLATAFVSIPALVAARASALDDASGGNEAVDVSYLLGAVGGMMLIAFVAILVGRYDRRVGRRYRSEDHGLLSPILGVFVQLLVGLTMLSFVYGLTPTGG